MHEIRIKVTNKIATNMSPDEVIVCGNSDYQIVFLFDSEWDTEIEKTARFSYVRDGKAYYKDKTFSGSIVDVPKLFNVRQVAVGVYVDDLCTTTAAVIWCNPSILCGNAMEEITQAEMAGLQAQVDKLTHLVDGLLLSKQSLDIKVCDDYLLHLIIDGEPVGTGEKTLGVGYVGATYEDYDDDGNPVGRMLFYENMVVDTLDVLATYKEATETVDT